MGFIGFLISLLLVILGAGYFLFGMGGSSVTVENPNAVQPASVADMVSGAGEISRYQAIKDQAESVKEMTEKRAADTMKQGVDQTADAPPTGGMTTPQIKIIEKKVDFGFGVPEKKRSIDTVVLHASYNSLGGDVYSVDTVVDIWKSYEVAPHYMIDRKGTIYRLVDDVNIAYHAGVSKMPDGRTNVNDFSIGVEILNTKDDKYTSAQYDAVNDLIAYLKGKHSIKTVVGHADIAPGRKDDPWNFDWKKVR
jgi:hypothetical protein